ncbi:zinc metalloprotease HtpX [Sporomusa aerivorans]|uniref:zinc metalloprotease HtpX n=1 Tax=Sporomusa aerivorans TaxID=204936 RepID=UPI00352AE74E
MNRMKTVLLLATLTGMLLAIGNWFGGRGGMMIMFLVSVAMNFGSYWFSDKIVLNMYGAREVTVREAPELYEIVVKLARKAKMPMPKVYIMETEMPNAFATGRDPEHAAVAATTGILRILNREELEGVMAHELAHVKNRDTLISTIVATLAGVISMIANMAQWAAMFGGFGRSNDEEQEGGAGGIIGSMLLIVLAPLTATLIQLGISRSREFLADESGGELTGKPQALASALEKLEYYAKHQALPAATPATAHMFIVNPLKGGDWLVGLFSTHPTTAQRVAKLQELAQRLGR